MNLDSTDRHSPHFGAPQTPPSSAFPTVDPRPGQRGAPYSDDRFESQKRPEPRRRAKRRSDAKLAMLLAALASAAAGIIHAAAAPAHWNEWPAAGAFFVFMAFCQLAWAVLILPFANRFFAVLGIVGNLGFLGLWAYSRWQGLPVGPHAGTVEAISLADSLAAVCEVGVVLGVVWALLPRESHGVLSLGAFRFTAALAAVVLGVALIPGVASALSHGGDGHGHGGSESEEGGHDHGETDTEEGGHDMEHEPESTQTPEVTEEAESPADAEEEDHEHAPGEEHD